MVQTQDSVAPQRRLRRSYRVLLLLLLACVVIAPAFQLRQVYRAIPARWSDLYPQWTAVKAALHGENPYSQAVTDKIERAFYGHVLGPKEILDRQNFVYPAHLIFLLGPFTVLPWWLVRLLFTVMAFPAVAAALWAWLKVCDIRLRGWERIAAYTLVMSSWPAVYAYQQTQPTIYIALMIALAVLFFQRKMDVWSGLMIALATTKPNLVGLVGLWLAWLAIRDRRWKWLASSAGWTLALVAGAEIFVPGWITEWLRTIGKYAHDPNKRSLLIRYSGHLGGAVPLIAAALVCWCLWKERAADVESPEFGRGVAILLAFTLCVIPTTGWMVYNDLLLIPGALVLIQGLSSEASVSQMLRLLAVAMIGCLLIATPIGVVMNFFSPDVLLWIVLPFFVGELVPILMLIALLGEGIGRPAGGRAKRAAEQVDSIASASRP